MNTPIQIWLGSSVVYFSPDLMLYDLEIIRELLFVKKYLSNKIKYQFEMSIWNEIWEFIRWRTSLIKNTENKMKGDYKMKEMKLVLFFLLSLFEHVYDNTCVYDNASILTLVWLYRIDRCNVWPSDRNVIIDLGS